jgi:hypothetical protein
MNIKKYHLTFLIVLVTVVSLYGQDEGLKEYPVKRENSSFSLNVGIGGTFYSLFDITRVSYVTTNGIFDGGITAFFDATYVEANINVIFGSLVPIYPDDPNNSSTRLTHIGFSVFGKYPFPKGKITWFPLLGINYQLFLSGQMKDPDGNDYGETMDRDYPVGGDYSASDQFDLLSIGFGGGMDVKLSQKFFWRSEIIINIKINSVIEADNRRNANKYDFDYFHIAFGPYIRMGVGYKF